MGKVLTMLSFLCLSWGSSHSQKSFLVKFQDSGNLSNSEWAEFNGSIPHLRDFTECHWEKLEFFNIKAHTVWNYCTVMGKNSSMDCTQLSYNRDLINVGRNIELWMKLRGKVGYFHVETFLHRSRTLKL